MTDEQMKEISALFDTQNKWDAFIELCYRKDIFRDQWFKDTMELVQEKLMRHPLGKEWNMMVFPWDDYVLHMNPKRSGKDSLSLHLIFTGTLKGAYLWINPKQYDRRKADAMIKEKESIILPKLPDFIPNNPYHDWLILRKTIPADIIDDGCDIQTFDRCMYTWHTNMKDVADKIFNDFFVPILQEGVADLFADISEITKTK